MPTKQTTKKYSIAQIALNLMAACFISGLVIAVTYFFTNPIAIKSAAKLNITTMKGLVTQADSFKPVEGKTGWYAADKGGKIVAYIVPAVTQGYGGPITMQVAVTTAGKVINYAIITHKETPGLGDNASKEPFESKFRGKGSADLEVTKDPSVTKDIQAMTGATITSKAVTKNVKAAVDQVVQFVGGKK